MCRCSARRVTVDLIRSRLESPTWAPPEARAQADRLVEVALGGEVRPRSLPGGVRSRHPLSASERRADHRNAVRTRASFGRLQAGSRADRRRAHRCRSPSGGRPVGGRPPLVRFDQQRATGPNDSGDRGGGDVGPAGRRVRRPGGWRRCSPHIFTGCAVWWRPRESTGARLRWPAGRSNGRGRSASRTGILPEEHDFVVPLDRLGSFPRNRTMILATGSQGEWQGGLHRIAHGKDALLRCVPGDRVILSSRTIPRQRARRSEAGQHAPRPGGAGHS